MSDTPSDRPMQGVFSLWVLHMKITCKELTLGWVKYRKDWTSSNQTSMAQLILVKELRMTPTKPNKMASGAFNIYFNSIFRLALQLYNLQFYNSKYGQFEMQKKLNIFYYFQKIV